MEIRMLRLTEPNPDNRYSTFKNQLETKYDFDPPEFKQIFESNKETVMQFVEKELRDYINNDDLCNDLEGMFPRRSMLTGEWYVSSVYFEDHFLSIETAFLGTDLGYRDDYLGLEAVFIYDSETGKFIFDGINSSAL
ncbi:MAG: hypothetical protein K6B74_05565 [Ruminococcus sp.]|nr:hypothetical protein [Ruminococcus sp.]